MWPNTCLTSLCLLLESFSFYFLVYNIISISCDVFGTHSIDLDFIEIKVCKQIYFIILFSHIHSNLHYSRFSLNMRISFIPF